MHVETVFSTFSESAEFAKQRAVSSRQSIDIRREGELWLAKCWHNERDDYAEPECEDFLTDDEWIEEY